MEIGFVQFEEIEQWAQSNIERYSNAFRYYYLNIYFTHMISSYLSIFMTFSIKYSDFLTFLFQNINIGIFLIKYIPLIVNYIKLM